MGKYYHRSAGRILTAAMLFGVLQISAAEPDARRIETARIQREIDRVHAGGGGRVVVAKGIHPCGTLYLKSGVELHLEEGAVLSGSSRSEDYDDAIPERMVYSYAGSHTNAATRKAFIYAENATDIAITGKGTVDGNGPGFFDHGTVLWKYYWAKPACMRPRMVVMMNCRRIRLADATFKDCPVWTMWIRHCEDIEVSRIRIDAEQKMINSDGIDFDACRRVRVGDSWFRTGDDCLVLRAIRRTGDGPEELVTEDVVVSNCVLNSACQGVRIGCPSDEVIRDAVFRNIVFTGRNAIGSQQPRHYLAKGNNGNLRTGGILFENWKVDCWGKPLDMFVDEGLTLRDFGHMVFRNFEVTAGEPFVIRGCGTTAIRDLRFENVRGRVGCARPVEVECVENVVFKDFEVSAGKAKGSRPAAN